MYCVSPADLSEFLPIIDLVFAHLDADDRAFRSEAMRELYERGEIDSRGVFGLFNAEGRLLGGLLSQLRPDGTVLLWPAAVDPEACRPVGNGARQKRDALRVLYETYVTYRDRTDGEAGATRTILLADHGQRLDTALLRKCGFTYLSKLVYLLCTDTHFMPRPEQPRLAFRPMRVSDGHPDANDWATMSARVGDTYMNTLDFPQLAAISPSEEILHGYAVGAVFRPELWFFVDVNRLGRNAVPWDGPLEADGAEPVGVLLLTAAPERDELELTYMGLLESARGKGFAKEMIAFAQEVARREGAAMLLTSADRQNVPAMRSYLGAGFRVFDRKTLFFR